MASNNSSSQPTVTPEYNDFSGVASGAGSASSSSNPYDALIDAASGDVKQLQARYSAHREGRNAQQKEKLLSSDFKGVSVDPILLRLERPDIEPGFRDTRHCLVFWARPPQKIKNLVAEVQRRVGSVVPNLWHMPPSSLHMTALEITHSQPPEAIPPLIETLRPHLATITSYTSTHRARLVKPLLSFDASALALSFLPAAGEGLVRRSSSPATHDNAGRPRSAEDDAFSYHHLRRDLYDLASRAGVHVGSRYVVPSAHLTIARFIEARDFFVDGDEAKGVDGPRVQAFMRTVEEINAWLKREFWPRDESNDDDDAERDGEGSKGIRDGGEWVVGEGKGLDCRMGTLWYGGGGETVMLGEGF
ncbi:RNA ligase/cyclic nucleotide phosphodiesterase [Phyllosticta citribraziliensis]|uniref:RNA ligase/cyclic nucleotide phosphodiesterase n=1 Tax=Phyllosticta citribraziliensis TaxID=989973 RepID=A0ABR1LDQ8_9PEZI